MHFIQKETKKFPLKFREIFPLKETVLRAHKMKSDEKPSFCQICVIFLDKMVHVVIDRFNFISIGFDGFFLTHGHHW